MKLLNNWAFLGAGAGIGFGVFFAPLIYILFANFFDGATFGKAVWVAIGNGFTWGVFGLIAGGYLSFINEALATGEDA